MLTRDGLKCVLSGATQPLEACHIVAHASANTTAAHEEQRRLWHVASRIFGPIRRARLDNLFKDKEAIAEVWNGLTLTRDYHELWDMNMIGFEPIDRPGGSPKTIWVRFQQFCKGLKEYHQADATGTVDEITNMYTPLQDNHDTPAGFRFNDGRLIITGNIYEIPCGTRENRANMLEVLQARWDVQRILFCAGGAGYDMNEYRPIPNAADILFPPFGEEDMDPLSFTVLRQEDSD